MPIDIHLSRTEGLLALLMHFGLLAALSWRLTRYSADLDASWLLLLAIIGQIILIFGFASHRLEFVATAAFCYLWVSWTFIGYVADLDRSDRITLSICNPIIALIAVYAVFRVVN